MGKVLAGMVEEKEGYELAGVIEPLQGQKPEDLGGFDVIIDFSNPANLQMLADYCRANNCPAVIATTGFEADQLKEIEKLGIAHFPVCIAKTQYSFSSDPKAYGVAKDFELKVRDIIINNGAEMIVVVMGEIMRMPGLPKEPQARHIDIVNGLIEGLS